ncbi:hypothetical protein B0A52_04372 [Exophiala mesophila]|uniref:Cytochrome P450 n=1 Tax=Exophiala mesophila TaxID=212818 RepID=A0A438N9A9_EXOME|nr:hypothetical protein B0A52_04372 [Exophiala mesophila]
MAGDRTQTIHELHKRFGPAVRIGPNEVSYADAETVKEIYSQQTEFMKAPVYEDFTIGAISMFSMRNKADHSHRRRLLSHAFSTANLSNTEPLIMEHIQKVVNRIDGCIGKQINMLLLFRKLSFDIIGELFLGRSFGGLDNDSIPPFLVDMDKTFIVAGIKSNFWPIYQIVRWLPLPAVKHFLQSTDRLRQYGKTAFETYIAQHGRDSGRKDLLTKILSPKGRDETLTDLQVYSEIGNLVFAGTDTTSTTLTYLFWELTRRPEWQSRLHEELSAQPEWVNGIPSYNQVKDLPILEAVIEEALRLHPAAPASLVRETPQGGRVLNGVLIPEKTVVSAQCYTTQRDPVVFPNPDAYLPERWMELGEMSNEMKVLFMPFSTGPRACLGKNLAMMELKMITATLLRRFRVKSPSTTTEESMSMKDHFLVIPKGGKCDLIFECYEKV